MSTYPLWHFGVPLSRASQYVGVLDVILGTIGTLVVSIDASDNSRSSYYYYSRTVSLFLPGWLSAILISSFLTQVMMGIVLYYSAGTKSRSLIQFWVYITALTALFTGMPIRVYELLIILEFYKELKEEQPGKRTTGGSSSSSTPPQNGNAGVAQPPPPYTQHEGSTGPTTGEDINSPKEENGAVGSSSIETRIRNGGGEGGGIGVIGQCQSCHQPTVVFTTVPATNLHGVQVVGGSGQQQQEKASTSAVPTAPVPSSSQPQSLNDSQDGVAGGHVSNHY